MTNELKTRKHNTMKHLAKHTVGAMTGLGIGSTGLAIVDVAVKSTLTTNPVANVAMGIGGTIGAVGGCYLYVDQKAKAHLDYKEIMSIEEMARALSDK